MNNNIPIYVISLKRKPEQLENFKKNNPNLSLNIIEAVDGIEATKSFSKHGIIHHQTKEGRFGCFLSHLKVLKEIADKSKENSKQGDEGNTDWYIIAEDDASIDPKFFNDWPDLSKDLTDDQNVIFLSRNWSSEDLSSPNKPTIVEVGNIFFGTQLYILTSLGAKQLLDIPEMNAFGTQPYDLVFGEQKTKKIYAVLNENGVGGYSKSCSLGGSSTEERYKKEKFNKDMMYKQEAKKYKSNHRKINNHFFIFLVSWFIICCLVFIGYLTFKALK